MSVDATDRSNDAAACAETASAEKTSHGVTTRENGLFARNGGVNGNATATISGGRTLKSATLGTHLE